MFQSIFCFIFLYIPIATLQRNASASCRLNFLIIIADNLGYTDISPYGSEISTPDLESLASNGGTIFTDFYTASTCSPTRSMLLSGTDYHVAGLGQMSDMIQRYPKLWSGKSGYEGRLND
ncbi:unnamed protein product [Rotaria sp. Silwood2]|nr:unnamed protein product [Rotaria sp. Silwood2]CAF4234611.1 unnamed protein product [Rotaria sp. Silwood2]